MSVSFFSFFSSVRKAARYRADTKTTTVSSVRTSAGVTRERERNGELGKQRDTKEAAHPFTRDALVTSSAAVHRATGTRFPEGRKIRSSAGYVRFSLLRTNQPAAYSVQPWLSPYKRQASKDGRRGVAERAAKVGLATLQIQTARCCRLSLL